MEPLIAIHSPSFVRYALRGEVVLEAFPTRGRRLAGRAVDRRVGTEDRDEGLEQREVDHLAAAALPLNLPEGHHDPERAVEPRHHVGESEGREGRRLVGKAVLVREARHRLDEGPESGLAGVGTGLAVAAHPHHDQVGVAVEQGLGAEPHAFEGAGLEVLDQDPGGRHEVEQDRASGLGSQVERDALLVAGVDLPRAGDAGGGPFPERIAAGRLLDLDHLGAVVGEHMGDRVARHEAGDVEHAHPVERARSVGPVVEIHAGAGSGSGTPRMVRHRPDTGKPRPRPADGGSNWPRPRRGHTIGTWPPSP